MMPAELASRTQGRFSTASAHQVETERRSPGQRKKERGEEGNGHGDGEGAEETAGNASRGDERQKNDNRRDRRTDQGDRQFAQRALDG